jgi:hypothetical protein
MLVRDDVSIGRNQGPSSDAFLAGNEDDAADTPLINFRRAVRAAIYGRRFGDVALKFFVC